MTSRRGSTIWPVVHEERQALIDDLKTLAAERWNTPSLCPGWEVHDVVAHLVDTSERRLTGVVGNTDGGDDGADEKNDG